MGDLRPPRVVPQGCVAPGRSRAAHALAPRPVPSVAGGGSGRREAGEGGRTLPASGSGLSPGTGARR
jgi:hypothetical protein